MFKTTHPHKSFESNTNVTDSLSVDFETSKRSERYNVSELDSQTAGTSMRYEVTRDVIDRVNEIQVRDDIANITSSITNARFLTHNY